MNQLSSTSIADECVLLTPLTVRELWSKTYNTEGKPDWSHIYPYYHENIVFQDTIQKVEGLVAFKGVCERLTQRCQSLTMELESVVQAENIIIMDWKMTMSFRKSPDTPLYGCTKLTLGDNGQIISQRDYYDLWGDIFNGIPMFKTMYRRFLVRVFG